MKELRDYLHYYLNQNCKIGDSIFIYCIDEDVLLRYNDLVKSKGQIKPILRRIEDITDEECIEVYDCEYTDSNPVSARIRLVKHWLNPIHVTPTPNQFHYLLKQGFDLFNLIDAGLAIDKKTLNG